MSQISNYQNLSVPAANDLLVVVDVDDTTMSPAGTTKNIEVQQLVSFTPGGNAYSESAPSGGILSVTNTHSAPTAPSTELVAAAGGDAVLGGEVSGDSYPRWQDDSNGKRAYGTGAAAGDTSMQRASGGGLTVTYPDGSTYDIARLTLYIAADLPVTSTSPVTVMSGAVGAAWYRVTGIFRYTQDSTGVAQNLGFTGGGSWGSGSRISMLAVPNTGFTATQVYPAETFAAGTVSLPAFATGDFVTVWIDGLIEFGSAGTFAVTAAEGTSGHSWTVKGGTHLDLMPVIA